MPDRRTFVTLDGLRGIAAFAVLTRHAPAFFGSPEGPDPSTTLFYESYLAVDFFFALSGFVLAHAYGERLCAEMSPSRFVALRLIRLYPLYCLALVLSLVVAQRQFAHGEIGVTVLITHLLAALMFLPSPASPVLLFPLNMPAWSLFLEFTVNVVFGLTARWLRVTLLAIVVSAAALVLATATIFGLLGFGHAGFGAMDAGNHWDGLGAGAIRATFSFFAGVLVHRAWQTWHLGVNVPPAVVAMALAAILVVHPSGKHQLAFDLVAALVAFPSLIFLGASSVPKGSLGRLFALIGGASYAVYVLQMPLYEFLHRTALSLTQGELSQFPWIVSGVAFAALILGIAIVIDRFFDRPLRKALSLRLLTPTKAQATAGSI